VFRLGTHAGFEAELAFIPSQDFRGGAGSAVLLTFPGTPAPQFAEKGRTILFLPSVVTDVIVGRLRPYAQFGVGMANVRRTTTLSGGTAGGSITTTGGVTGSPVSTERTANDLALGAGAGLDVRVWPHVSIAADVRYVHLVGDSSTGDRLDITRIGGRVNWRF